MVIGTKRRRDVSEPSAGAHHRWLIDRRVAALIFVGLTVALPIHAVQVLGDALAESTLRAWLVFADVALKSLVMAAFAVFIYKRKASRRPARSPKAFIACAAAILSPAFLLPLPDAEAAIWALVVGESIVIVAVCFTLASVLCLGTCFGVLPEVRGLVMRGPYRFVRHPVYTGEILAFAGFVLASQRLMNVIPLIVFVVAQNVRLRMEEAVLTAEFPEQYGAFAARTPRLIPRLGPSRAEPSVSPPVGGEAAATAL